MRCFSASCVRSLDCENIRHVLQLFLVRDAGTVRLCRVKNADMTLLRPWVLKGVDVRRHCNSVIVDIWYADIWPAETCHAGSGISCGSSGVSCGSSDISCGFSTSMSCGSGGISCGFSTNISAGSSGNCGLGNGSSGVSNGSSSGISSHTSGSTSGGCGHASGSCGSCVLLCLCHSFLEALAEVQQAGLAPRLCFGLQLPLQCCDG